MSVGPAVWRRVPIRGPGRLLVASARRRAARGPLLAGGPAGIRLLVDPLNPPELSVHLWGVYEPEVVEAASRLLTVGGVVVDIGANCGVLSCIFGALVGPGGLVVAVDPSEPACARIAEQGRAARLPQVVPVCAAVGEGVGRSKYLTGTVGIGVLPEVDRAHTTGVPRMVEIVSFEEAMRRGGADRLDLLKVDTDGSEVDVLRSAFRTLESHRPAVIFEHFVAGQRRRGHGPAELAELLRELRYELWKPLLRARRRWTAGPPRVLGFRPADPADLDGPLLDGSNLVAVPRGTGAMRLGYPAKG